jgi:type I restriction enzyme, S subunit
MMDGKYRTYAEFKDSGIEWIGDVPSGWQIKPLFSVAETGSIKNEDGAENNVLSLSYGSIVRRDVEENFGLLPESFNTYQLVKPGDLILRLTDLQNDKRSLRVGQAKEKGIITSAYLRLTAKKNRMSERFLYRLLHSYDTTKVFYGMGGGLRQSMKFEEMKRLEILIPSIKEQETIANFLDQETAKIDTLIEKQQQLIKLLKEKRQAVISHAVTKGLTPNTPMRDSGVEWLGEVPEHWTVTKFKYLVVESTAGPYGSSLTKSMYTSSGVRVYGQQQVIPDDFSVGDYYISEEKFESMRRYEVFPGDVLISVMGTVGKVAVVPEGIERGIINPRLVKYKVLKEKILPKFIKASILSDVSQSQLLFAAQGSTMDGLNMQILGELPIAYPPLDEQVEIFEEVSRQEDKFSNLLDRAQRAVDLLLERRTALISAAVTGKIDVRNWQAPSQTNNQKIAA